MKITSLLNGLIVLGCGAMTLYAAEELPRLSLHRSEAGLELSWPGITHEIDGSVIRPYFELQHSLDLHLWEPLGERMRVAAAMPGQSLSTTLAPDQAHAFYRLLRIRPNGPTRLASGGAQVFGYADAMAQALQGIGQISVDQFATLFTNDVSYRTGISWDPTTGQFWSQFNADPEEVNQGKDEGDPGYRTFDFRLTGPERALFERNGFVVSQRLGSSSCADVFYKVWYNDLPVFVSTDAILQAWHRTFDAMLEEIEETYLFDSLGTMLDGMAGRISAASQEVGDGVLRESLLDADYFLAVARSVLSGTNAPVLSLLGQDAQVAETVADINAHQSKRVGNFMGFCREVDFSQFQVRGHYTHSERLARYFQCMMWLGRMDVPVAGGPFERCPGDVRTASQRELGLAVVLWHLLNTSGQFDIWRNAERIIQTFVGPTDSLTFGQLGGLLAGASVRTLSDLANPATLEKLQGDIGSGALGVQNIRSDYFVSPLGSSAQARLPQTFTVFGQKFVPDSWALAQCVFDSILWDEDGHPGPEDKVQRRVPGALDVAFSVLGNNQVVPDLLAQMQGTFADLSRPHARRFRDGLPYQHNLAAVRAVMDQQTPEAWDGNLYMSWLASLRELSAPTTDPKYPDAMRTRAWAMKTLNTQLSSWTQLRHDTILYAKQIYAPSEGCFYPAGFVEPRVSFWQRLRATATRAANLIGSLPYSGTYSLPGDWVVDPTTGDSQFVTNSIALTSVQSNQVAHLHRFADTMEILQTLAEKELAGECFSSYEDVFIRNLIENAESGGSDGVRKFDGWYPKLFYHPVISSSGGRTPEGYFQNNFGSNAPDQLVADVYTDVRNSIVGDPGSVLHQGVGPVNLLMVAIENGGDRLVFAGPVLSHYEFEVIGSARRLNDNEWSSILNGSLPPDLESAQLEGITPPPWTQDYLVP